MMQVGMMRMSVQHRCVSMPVDVGFAGIHARRVMVPMMFVVAVPMLVLDGLVDMLVVVPLGQVQP